MKVHVSVMLVMKYGSELLNQLQASRLVMNSTGPTKAWLPVNSRDTWCRKNECTKGQTSALLEVTCII